MKFSKNQFPMHLAALVLCCFVSACGTTAPQDRVVDADGRTRRQVAIAMFQERCKRAGVRIYEAAENVEGVFLMKLRPNEINFSDQFKLDDPYGRDLDGEGYFHVFLKGTWPRSIASMPGEPPRIGYDYVEAIDPADGKRYRYTGSTRIVGRKKIDAPDVQNELRLNPNYDLNNYAFVLDKVPANGPAPRYGVTYDDISTREEREYWIAGSSLKVIDLHTNKVMAERIGYMVDVRQGDDGGGRSPWLFAADNACPGFQRNPLLQRSSTQRRQTQDFVEKVLKPKLEN